MLRLLCFIPADRVILAQDGSASLISMLEGVEAGTSANLPDKILIPLSWKVLTLWHIDDVTEETMQMEQKVEVLSAEGESVFVHTLSFEVRPPFRNFRNLSSFAGFPVGESGEAKIELSLRELPDGEWEKRAEFPITVNRKIKEQNDGHDENDEEKAAD